MIFPWLSEKITDNRTYRNAISKKIKSIIQNNRISQLELLEENGIKVYEVQNIDDFDGLSACVGDFHVIVINKDFIY